MKILLILLLLFVFSSSVSAQQSVLINIKTPLNTVNSTKIDDEFSAKIVEDIKYNGSLMIPKGSYINGNVENIRKRKILRTDACISVLINKINMPDGKTINLNNKEVKLNFMDPRAKTFKKRTLNRLPIMIGTYGTSIPLGFATALGDGAIYGISMGASMIGGFISGFVSPNHGYSRTDSAILRCAEATPMGAFLITTEKGHHVNYLNDSYVVINFRKSQKKQIAECISNYKKN